MGWCSKIEERWSPKFMWRPYPDERLLSAQICSVIATIPAAINVVPLCLSIFAMIWFQLLCCFRVSRTSLKFLMLIAIITGVAMICSGLFIPQQWGGYLLDGPSNKYLVLTALVSGTVWICAGFKILHFFKDGDYDRWERRLESAAAEGDTEEQENSETPAAPTEARDPWQVVFEADIRRSLEIHDAETTEGVMEENWSALGFEMTEEETGQESAAGRIRRAIEP